MRFTVFVEFVITIIIIELYYTYNIRALTLKSSARMEIRQSPLRFPRFKVITLFFFLHPLSPLPRRCRLNLIRTNFPIRSRIENEKQREKEREEEKI